VIQYFLDKVATSLKDRKASLVNLNAFAISFSEAPCVTLKPLQVNLYAPVSNRMKQTHMSLLCISNYFHIYGIFSNYSKLSTKKWYDISGSYITVKNFVCQSTTTMISKSKGNTEVIFLAMLATGLIAASGAIVAPVALAQTTTPAAAQLSSTVSIQPNDTKPVKVTMNSNDFINAGITHSNTSNTGDVIVNEPGAYLIVAAGQVGKTSGTTNCNVDLWLSQNGKDVSNSNTRASIMTKDDTIVLVSQAIMQLAKGDNISAMLSVSATGQGCGLINTAPPGEPDIPAIIFSIAKIG